MIFILIALFIDGLQAAMSWGIAAIAAFPVTAGGSVAGCVAGNSIAGQVGCWVGGSVLGLMSVTPLGLAANALVATVTVPVGIALGFAISMCLSIVLGWCFLVPLMLLSGMNVSWKRLIWGGGEMIPGLNNIPFWTALTIASLWKSTKSKHGRKGILALAGAVVVPTRPIIMSAKEATGMFAARGARGWTPQPEEWAPQPDSGEDLVRTATQRTPMRDIHPMKPNVQNA